MYESKFVPRLFGEWAERLVEAASLEPGQRVLDVACGTGVVARAAADRVGASGSVAGLDLNEAMLSVARRLRPDLEWQQGGAADLPFANASVDVVLCQAALMFFPDVALALREMARVVTPGGTVAVQVWDHREDQPAYRPFIDVVGRDAGPEAVGLLSAYFVIGDLDELIALLTSAGLEVGETSTQTSLMRFGSVEELVAVEVESTPLGERLSPDVLKAIVEDSRVASIRSTPRAASSTSRSAVTWSPRTAGNPQGPRAAHRWGMQLRLLAGASRRAFLDRMSMTTRPIRSCRANLSRRQ